MCAVCRAVCRIIEESTVMNEGMIVFVTIPCDKAQELAKVLLQEKVAACVSVLEGIESVFWWEGKIDRAKESLLLIKTQYQLFDAVKQTVENHHPYDVPEIVGVKMSGVNNKYLRWIGEVTGR